MVVTDDHVRVRLEIVTISSLDDLEPLGALDAYTGHSVVAVFRIPFALRWTEHDSFVVAEHGSLVLIGRETGVRRYSTGFHHEGADIVLDPFSQMCIHLQVAEDVTGPGVGGRQLDLHLLVPFRVFDVCLKRALACEPPPLPIVTDWHNWAHPSNDVSVIAGRQALQGVDGSRCCEETFLDALYWQDFNPRRRGAIALERQLSQHPNSVPEAWIDRLVAEVPESFRVVSEHLAAAGLRLVTSPLVMRCPRPLSPFSTFQRWALCGDNVLQLSTVSRPRPSITFVSLTIPVSDRTSRSCVAP